MKYYSTNNRNLSVSFRKAVLKGLAEDGGLFMPVEIRSLPTGFWNNIDGKSFNEISFEAAKLFIDDEIPGSELEKIIDLAINFPAPLIELKSNNFVLELFHGPTLAFKDFGARFMARTMAYFNKDEQKELTILVATSGDTGSAVAYGFHNVEGIRVILLYPSGKVSETQEKQLTTIGGNVTALEITGSFDDCQRLVKQAFTDSELNKSLRLSSANSINIVRLIPQSFYYLNAFAQLKEKDKPLYISVPSGNFGNLTAGLFAHKLGLPVNKFIAAVNSNRVFLDYIQSGKFIPRPSLKTISNAMDVGNPSNFVRITDLFNNDHKIISDLIFSASFSDSQTTDAIKSYYNKYGYIFDPHGAVGQLALGEFLLIQNHDDFNAIVLETAHPAKFIDSIDNNISRIIEMPERLKRCLSKEKHSIKLSCNFEELKEFLLSN